MDRLHAMALHLFVQEPKMSRNRHFAAYDDPRYRAALALNRRLRALLQALLAARRDGGRLVVEHGERRGEPAVRLLVTLRQGRQASVLSAEEWRVFLAHPVAQTCVAQLST